MCSENKELTIEEKRRFLYNKTADLQKVTWDVERVSKQDVQEYNAAKDISDICCQHGFDGPIEILKAAALVLLRQKERDLQKEVDQYIK